MGQLRSNWHYDRSVPVMDFMMGRKMERARKEELGKMRHWRVEEVGMCIVQSVNSEEGWGQNIYVS